MSDHFLPYGKQQIDQTDINAVCEVLQSDFLTSGPKVSEFEDAFAEFVGARHAIAVNSATAALHLAIRVAGVQEGDRVITSPNTFLSSANCAAFEGATPDFCDIDPDTNTMCPASLEKQWTDDVRAVVPVSYGGQSADMPAISKIAKAHDAIVIEDASHGTGGGFQVDGANYKQGSHPWADLTVFSFHPVKTLTTGEGGMLVTNNDEFAKLARSLRSHGMTREPSEFQGLGSENPALAEHGPWYYEMQELGYNYRITDLQCALGLSQLKRLPDFIARRQEIVKRYNEAFADLPWFTLPGVVREPDGNQISWHLYSPRFDFAALGKTRTEVMLELRAKGIGTQVLYIPVYLQPYYRKTFGYQEGKCPKAEAFYSQTLSLPLHACLTDADVDRVIAATRELSS